MRSRVCFLLLRILRCFSSPGWLRRPMHSAGGEPDRFDPSDSGYPIRESWDQHLFGSSPRLIASYHALHRLPAPRHPPCALSNLTTLILVSLAPLPGLTAVPRRSQEPSRASRRKRWSRLRRHRTIAAVDSYSQLCHYSVVKEPDVPADRRRETSVPAEINRVRSAPATCHFRFQLQQPTPSRPGGADGI